MRLFLPVALITLFNCSFLSAQELDSTFHSALPVRASLVTRMIKQADDKVLLGGQIAFHGNVPVNNLIRITADGALDTTFSFSYSPDYYVHDFELMDDGDIAVLLRRFQGYKDLVFFESKILVLAADGTLKEETNTIPNANAIATQADGKILVCAENLLLRYNPDLSTDNAFNAVVSFDKLVSDVKVDGDKIFAAGMFHIVNGVAKHSIVKLNLDGSIDNTFDTGSGTTDYVGALTIAPDGKILTGDAYINEFDGQVRRGMVRLNTDGSVDGTFGMPFQNGISEPVVTADGIYACSYMAINGVHGLNLFRLKNDGSWDNTFKPILFKGFDPTRLQYIAAGDQLVASGLPINGNIYGISKYDDTGNLIPAFAPKISRQGTIQFGDQRADKIIVGGDFVRIDSVNTFGVAQLNLDGTVDNSFSATNDNGAVVQMELLDDQTTLISTGSKFYKVNNTGALVTDFNWTPGGFLYQVVKFKVLDNDKILAADANTLVLLNSNGSVDDSFYLGHTSNSSMYGFDVQGDSVIYAFNTYDEDLGQFVTRINRYTMEGKIDTTFHVGEGPQNMQPSDWTSVTMVKVLHNGEVLIGGGFTQFDGLSVVHGLVKLSKDGNIDEDFNANQLAATGPMGFFDPEVEQIGSKVYIRSDYSIYVVNVDGTVDSFQIPLTVDGISDIIAVENDESDNAGGRRKSDDEDYILALGSFQNASMHARMSVVKIAVNAEAREETVTVVEETVHEPLALEIYPQPTSGILNIRFDSYSTGFHAAIYGLSGRKYMEQTFNATGVSDVPSMDVSQIPAGFYTIKVISKSGKTGYSKFVRLP